MLHVRSGNSLFAVVAALTMIGCGGNLANVTALTVTRSAGVTGHTLAGTVFKAQLIVDDGSLPRWLVTNARSHRTSGCLSHLLIDDSVAERFNLCLTPYRYERASIFCQRGLLVVLAYALSHATTVRLHFIHMRDVEFPTILVKQPNRTVIAVMFQVLPKSSASPIS
jgi:hypothetical protein